MGSEKPEGSKIETMRADQQQAVQQALGRQGGDIPADVAAKLGISLFGNRSKCAQAAVIALASVERTAKEEKVYQGSLSYLEFVINGTPEQWMKKDDNPSNS